MKPEASQNLLRLAWYPGTKPAFSLLHHFTGILGNFFWPNQTPQRVNIAYR